MGGQGQTDMLVVWTGRQVGCVNKETRWLCGQTCHRHLEVPDLMQWDDRTIW